MKESVIHRGVRGFHNTTQLLHCELDFFMSLGYILVPGDTHCSVGSSAIFQFVD